jgi:hypothetical protein
VPFTHTEVTYWLVMGLEHGEIVKVPLMDGDPADRKVPGLAMEHKEETYVPGEGEVAPGHVVDTDV